MPDERITVTLPQDMVRGIDRHERNRSKFVRQAVRNELERRRKDALRASLSSPHPESGATEELGLNTWLSAARAVDRELVDPEDGTPVAWTPGRGWTRGPE